MKVALASDHAGFLLKEYIKSFLNENEITYQDFGTRDETPVDYPDLAYMAARAVQMEIAKRIIICVRHRCCNNSQQTKRIGPLSAATLFQRVAPGLIMMLIF